MDSPTKQSPLAAASRPPIMEAGQSPMQYLNAVMQNRPNYQGQYDASKAEMEKAYSARSVEGEDAAQWAALARGFAKPAANFWQSLAQAGGEKGETVAEIDAQNLKNSREVAKSSFEQSSKLLQNENMLMRSLTGGLSKGTTGSGIITRQQKDGTIIVIDRMSGAEVRRFDPNESDTYTQALKIRLKQSEALDTEDPEERNAWATKMALQDLQGSRQAVGNKSPVPGSSNAVIAPSVYPGGTLGGVPSPLAQAAAAPIETETLPPEAYKAELQAAITQRNAMAMDDPKRVELGTVIAEMRRNLLGQNPATPQPSLRFKGAETEAEKTGRGGERGKAMEKEFHDLQATGMAAQNLAGNLEVLESLYTKHGENIPSGAAAGVVSQIKSGLSTFGIQFEGIAATDAVGAIATKGALQSRTADGTNLLPGAMSNYEDKLLQKTFPVLSQTAEGRLLQIQIMKAQLGMKSELAQAARNFYQKNGKLDARWYQVAQDIAAKNPFFDPKRMGAIEEYARRLNSRAK